MHCLVLHCSYGGGGGGGGDVQKGVTWLKHLQGLADSASWPNLATVVPCSLFSQMACGPRKYNVSFITTSLPDSMEVKAIWLQVFHTSYLFLTSSLQL
jgi:hypothetical protein